MIVFAAQRDLMLPAAAAIARFAPTVIVRHPEQLDAGLLDRLRPDHVVLPDWSWRVPEQLLERASFVGFHAAQLPDYRGGSPLQHQILDGLRETRLTMFRIVSALDAGPVLLDAPLSLEGTIGEIWARIATLVPPMVEQLWLGACRERQQAAGGFSRRRRTPEQSELTDPTRPLTDWYDLVRALDTPYPNAFLRIGGKRITLRTPRFDGQQLIAEAVITEDGTPARSREEALTATLAPEQPKR